MYSLTSLDANGKILQIVTGQTEDVYSIGIHPDAVSFQQSAPPSMDYYWENAWVAMLPQPDPNSTFNYITKVWEDGRLLADVKVSQKMVINLSRAKANQTSFTYETKQIAVDALSRSDIEGTNGYVLANHSFPSGWPGGWKCMDNTYVAIADVATWNLFYAAMVNQGTANFTKAQTLKAAIDAAITITEVEAIVW